MSSPNENQGPPSEPPPVPDQATPPAAPPEDPAVAPDAAPNAPDATASTAPTSDAPQQAAAGTGGQGQGPRNRRPMSSLSFFLPFPMARQPEGGDGSRAGMTWTVEVFPNDGEEGHMGNGDAGQAPNAPAGADDGDTPSEAGGNVNVRPGADGGGGPRGAGAGPEQLQERTIFFVIGPDGQPIPPPGGGPGGAAGGPNAEANGGGPNLWLPFAFPFAFGQQGPPAPDPAKAAELLASLPTIGSALLRRVDKVIVAEDTVGGKDYDDRGWRCGICLEGLDVDANEPASAHPVKSLPCNHLFHEECLQPWFTSHHTCPTCRLDLDPLRTLHGPRQTRGNPLRPSATGSGRTTPRNPPHPYARDREARDRPRSGAQTLANPSSENLANPVEAPAQEDQQQPQQQEQEQQPAADAQQQEGSQNQAEDAPGTPADAPPPGAGPGGAGGPWAGMPILHEILSNLVASATAAAFGELAQGRMFDNPLTASPAPMERPATAPPGTTPSPSPAAASSSTAAAQETTEEAAAEPSAPSGSAEAGPSAPSPTRPTPERRPHIFLHSPPRSPSAPAPAETRPATAAGTHPPPPGLAPPGLGAGPGRFPNLPPLDFFFLRPPGAGRPQEATPTPAETPTPSSQPTLVPQSLGSWTEQREKTLGWRCDAVECLVAVPVPDENAEEMDVDEQADDDSATASDKEMLSIYAPLQGPFPPASEGEEPHSNSAYVILACPHRWHRTCLETAERSAGHRAEASDDGREWVRCQKCRKEGWVIPRSEPEAVTADAVPA